MVSGDCVARGHRYAEKAVDVMFNPVGQVVGQLNRVEKAADVVRRLVEEYLESVDRLNAQVEAATAAT
jgi:NAD(P)H-dependent flavin oxidoreductase YrpB (nitropropane dioxygenase family)